MKYYTAFYFASCEPGFTSDVQVDNLHVTHKYLGEQSVEALQQIVDRIRLYFKWQVPRSPGIWCFDRIDFFDEESVVLLCHSAAEFMASLHEELDGFRKDNHPSYNPHITIAHRTMRPKNLPLMVPVHLRPIKYRLVSSAGVVEEWGL